MAEQDEENKRIKQMNIEMLRKNGAAQQADELAKTLIGVDERVKAYRKKAINLLNHSLKEMPADVVIDYGEPTSSRDTYSETGLNLPVHQDGILHDYVALYYRAGDKASAEKLGDIVAGQLETIIKYFEKSDAYFAGSAENNPDLFAAMDAYFKLNMAATNPETGDKNGKLANRTKNRIKFMYDSSLPELIKALEQKATDNGESTRRGTKNGRYAGMMFELQDYFEAMAVHYGIKEGPKGAPLQPQPNMENMNLEELMKQMPVADSVKE
jgi:hypothetical protein